ncbi:hypothetical protein [Anaerosporomusa subterranea]|nr:hypothetical protein [Anaerosporomusa subterranea]
MHRFSARVETGDLIVRVWEDAGFACVGAMSGCTDFTLEHC